VRLSGRGAKALRDAGTLRVRVSAQIKAAKERPVGAQQGGRIKAPQPPAFRPGIYTGTTGQGLPIVISVSQTAVRSVLFRWHGRCGDGKAHTNTVILQGRARVHHGRFSLRRRLDTQYPASSRVSVPRARCPARVRAPPAPVARCKGSGGTRALPASKSKRPTEGVATSPLRWRSSLCRGPTLRSPVFEGHGVSLSRDNAPVPRFLGSAELSQVASPTPCQFWEHNLFLTV
jgi:hypothetical protein